MKKLNIWSIPPHLLTEKEVQYLIIHTYEKLGIKLLKFSQPFRAAQTKGIPDLRCHHAKGTWWHEVKTQKGLADFHKQRADHVRTQRAIHIMLEKHGDVVIVGGLNTGVQYMRDNGIVNLTRDFEGHW